ncbi:RhoGAP-domain-containing protein [Peniophora sp. CONT]|nr:RhoGAP-domain-containing protein [Peniophora sp. CONT]
MAYVGDSTPSSRATSLDVPQQGPIQQFDFQLKVLADSYLAFFNERRRIEENYVDSLIRLHTRTRTIDAYLDDKGDLTTARKAWTELRDGVDRETTTRQAFLNSLSEDVIMPLQALRDSQDRIRKRVKEDIKDSTQAHADYVEKTLPTLKRAYVRKAQEVDDYRSSSSREVNAAQAPVFEQGNHHFLSRSNASSPPPHSRPMERRASLGASRYRDRDRSPNSQQSSNAFQDIAQHGKRQLNQLMGLLDKNGTMRNAESSLKMVRAKRETDEADREYRKGVVWAETLRLRRVKTLQAGYNSLETLFYEASATVKRALLSYTDSVLATTTTQSALASHARSAIEKVNPKRDQQLLAAPIPQLFKAAVPQPQFYHNFEVGVCKDLTFGINLSDYASARGLPEGEIPRVLAVCIAEVDARGLDVEGIYRISGRHSVVSSLQHRLERNEREFSLDTDDVHAAASLLKAYLRSLPDPLFKFPLQERVKHTEDHDEQRANGFVLLRSKIRRLPAINRYVLRAVLEHLARVVAHVKQNKMDSKNLGIVFATVIFGEEDTAPVESDLLRMASWKDTVMEDLIENAYMLFQFNEDPNRPVGQAQTPQRPPQQLPPQQLPPQQPPLQQNPSQMAPPPPPLLLPQQDPQASPLPPSATRAPATAPYPMDASSYARASGMIQPIAPAEPVEGPRSAPTAIRVEQDFTPELPPRPSIQHSIHPSARMSNTPMNPPPGARTKERPGSMPPPRRDSATSVIAPAQDTVQPPPFDPEATLRTRPSATLRGVSDVTIDEQLAGDAIAAMSFTQDEVKAASIHSRPASRHSSRSSKS